MQPTVQTNPLRSILIFIIIGLLLLGAVVLGVRFAKGRSDHYAQAGNSQTVAQQPQQQQNQPARSQAQTDEQKKAEDQRKAEEQRKAAEQKAADDKKKADEQKAAEEKKKADEAAAEKKAKEDQAAKDKKAEEDRKKVAAATTAPNTSGTQTPSTVPSTGAEDMIAPAVGLVILAFIGVRYTQSRRRLTSLS
jgi:outer membrane biosynthesis protein TonB